MPSKILIVEDDYANQRVASLFLKKMGYEVEVAENGHVAIELANKEAFQLILMDCQMPIMDGYQATKAIRSQPGTNQNVPIIALTANVVYGINEACIEAGMNDVLNKPIQFENMQKIISAWLKSD